MLFLQATTTIAHNPGGPSTAYVPVMVFFVFATAFPILPLVLGRFLRPWKYQKDKMRPYECGIDPQTGAHDRFTVRYYLLAILFLIFDVETIFLFPFAVAFTGLPAGAFIAMMVFLLLLVEGLVWAWNKGILTWNK